MFNFKWPSIIHLILISLICFEVLASPALAVNLTPPKTQGIHITLLEFPLATPGQPLTVPELEFSDYVGAVFGFFLSWGVGAIVYGLSNWGLNHLAEGLSISPAIAEGGAILAFALSSSWTTWALGNRVWQGKQIAGDWGLTLAGTLIGEAFFLGSLDLKSAEFPLDGLLGLIWLFSVVGGIVGYNLSLQPISPKSPPEQNAVFHIQNETHRVLAHGD